MLTGARCYSCRGSRTVRCKNRGKNGSTGGRSRRSRSSACGVAGRWGSRHDSQVGGQDSDGESLHFCLKSCDNGELFEAVNDKDGQKQQSMLDVRIQYYLKRLLK